MPTKQGIVKGARIGALASTNPETVYLVGYGVYAGEHVPPETVSKMHNLLNLKQPRIDLDNGESVWGFECWWGPARQIRKLIGDREVIEVTVTELRDPNSPLNRNDDAKPLGGE